MKAIIYRKLQSKTQGNYYSDWLESLAEKGYEKLSLPEYVFSNKKYKKIIISHSMLDLFINRNIKFLIKNFFPIIFSEVFIYLLRKRNTSLIIFSKNDYKDFEAKINFFKKFSGCKIITHTKKALKIFLEEKINAEWLPFGFREKNLKKFVKNQSKKIDIGFRGNLNSKWNNSLRENLINKISKIDHDLNFDILPSINGENFLYGDKYYEWTAKCKSMINSPSAFGTVGPKFFEQMYLGVVPLSIFDNYENILKKNINYLSIDENDDLQSIKRKITDQGLLSKIRKENLQYVKKFEISRIIDKSLFL